jgi:SH3-like domain-containing protein
MSKIFPMPMLLPETGNATVFKIFLRCRALPGSWIVSRSRIAPGPKVWPGRTGAACAAFFINLAASGAAWPVHAAPDIGQGTVTGLPTPRYVSLKSDRVNLREGPSKDNRVAWVFQRAGLPVEVTAEFETWRRIRDAEGTEGWVLHSLLSGRRTALVAPWAKSDTFPLIERADEKAVVLARLQPGVIATIKKCDGTWCRIVVQDVDGYMRQERLWGVYPNEKIE